MITVYYESGDVQLRYELDSEEYEYVIKNLLAEEFDLDDMFNDSLEILRDVSALADDEMDEDDEIDQTVAVAFLWHYFNHLAPPEERIEGDIVLSDKDDGANVSVLPASAIEVE